MMFSFLIKKQYNWNLYFFITLGIPRVTHWIISFMLHISVITSLTYINELLEIFLKLSTKTIQVHLIIGTTSVESSCSAAMVR